MTRFYHLKNPIRTCLSRGGLLLVFLLSGCGNPDGFSSASVSESPVMGEEAPSSESYKLKPGDEVHIKVFREPDLSGDFTLNPKGRIRHPLLGDVSIKGMSAALAESHLTFLLGKKYLIDPQVTLTVSRLQNAEVLLMGEVSKPGPYPLSAGEETTLLEIIARAGGFTELASPNRVRVIRTVNGEKQTVRIKVADMLAGKTDERNIVLKPDDIVVIPEIRF